MCVTIFPWNKTSFCIFRLLQRYGVFVYPVSQTSMRDMLLFCSFSKYQGKRFLPGRQSPKIPKEENVHISKFYVFRCSTKEIFENFVKLTRKTLRFYPVTLLKEKTSMHVFSDEFCEIFKKPYLQKSSKQLLFYGKIFYK